MFVRISTATIKKEREADVRATIWRLEKSMDNLEGIKHWITFLTDSGELTVLAAYDTTANGQRTAHINTARWADAADLFQELPRVVEGEMLAFVNMS
jgi:hypothetical protein